LFFIFLIIYSFCFLQALAAQTPHSENISDELKLSPAELSAFKTATQNKVLELQNCITVIGSKETSKDKVDRAFKGVAKLFMPDAKMEVTKIKNGEKKSFTFPIMTYFSRLRNLPYTNVEINFYDMVYVSDFQLGDDGNYHATAIIFQEFKRV
jgi:hypothetical protein